MKLLPFFALFLLSVCLPVALAQTPSPNVTTLKNVTLPPARSATSTGTLPTNWDVLVELYWSTNGPGWTPPLWNLTNDPCPSPPGPAYDSPGYAGVTCRGHTVTMIFFFFPGLFTDSGPLT